MIGAAIFGITLGTIAAIVGVTLAIVLYRDDIYRRYEQWYG